MISPQEFADRQLALAAEFAGYTVDHPEIDERLPERSYIFFEVEGEPEFNQYSRELAERRQREEEVPVVLVRTKGLAPPPASRLIDPVIDTAPAVA